MANHNVLEWDDIPQVAMSTINEAHREELDIVNRVNAAILGRDSVSITQLCKEWLAHIEAHFTQESVLMEKYGFPAYQFHYAEHVKALQGLREIINTWNEYEDLDALTIYVQITWPKWYLNHVATMDTVASVFVEQSVENE